MRSARSWQVLRELFLLLMHLDLGQVRMEFDFRREAAVMDAVADNLRVCMLSTTR